MPCLLSHTQSYDDDRPAASRLCRASTLFIGAYSFESFAGTSPRNHVGQGSVGVFTK